MKKQLFLSLHAIALALFSTPASVVAQSPSLFFPFSEPSPSYPFTHFNVPLTASGGWRIGSPSGPLATESDLAGALSQLGGLSIQMSGFAQYFVDNVSFAGWASSSFDGCNADGWTIRDFHAADCNSLIGSPSGSMANGGLAPFFDAPAEYLGDKEGAYGGVFSFDMFRNNYAGDTRIGGFLSITPVPEPSALMLFAVAALVMVARLRACRSRPADSR